MKKVILIVVIILILIGALAYPAYYYFFVPNNNIVAAFDESILNLIVEGETVVSKHDPKIVDEEILLPIDIVKKYFDPNIYWDGNLKKVTITTEDRVIRMKTDSLDAMVNNEPVVLNIPAVEDEGTVFIPIEFLSDFYNIEVSYLKENNIIIIDYKNRMVQTAEPLGEQAVIRRGRTIRYPVIKQFEFGNKNDNVMRIFEEYDKWYKVRTRDGVIGYIEKKFVVVKWLTVNNIPIIQDKRETAWKPENGKINLVWEMMYGKRPDLSEIGKIEGLDVISPTWFQVIDDKGTVMNRADAKYVEWAHDNGYKIWALFANDFGDPLITSKILNNTDIRDHMIRQILSYASIYNLDGINIDFENINIEDKDALTQFIREITPFLREQGLTVSIDIGVPDGSENYSRCYDSKALSEVVDYVMLMTYDQHWRTSPEAGSVAQISWVEKKLIRALEMVPEEKLLLGLPFYIRLWEEKLDDNGKVKVSNPKVLSMEAAKNLIKENDAQPVWDDESGQFYAEYKKDDATYKIWLEDWNSINLKSSLVHKYKLAGTAAWRRSDEAEEIWSLLNKNLKVISSYQQWNSENNVDKFVFGND